jgi:anti-anti-sigma regulatory factor
MDDMLIVNVDTVGEAVIVECEGIIMSKDDALHLRDAITERAAASRVIVVDLSRVCAAAGVGLRTLLSVQRWARHNGILLKLFNARSSVRHDLERADSLYDFEFASLGEVMTLVIDAGNREPAAA